MVGIFCLTIWQGCFKFRTSDPKAISQFAAKGINLRLSDFSYGNKRNIHYAETGDTAAPTIYFIHGTPGSWNNFIKFLQDSALGTQYRMISIDRPGFGYSNFGHAESMANQVSAFNQFIRSKANGKPVLLVGHSLGGPILVGMAAADSNIAHTLIFLAASVSPDLEPPERWRNAFNKPALRWLVPGAFRPSNDEMLDFKKWVKDMPAMMAAVTSHTYIIHGTKDMLVPYENLEYAEKNLIHARSINIVTLEGENHFLPWSRFDDLRALLLLIRKQLD